MNGDPAPGRSPGPPAAALRQVSQTKSTTATSTAKLATSTATAAASANTTLPATISNSNVLRVNDVLFNTDYTDDDKIDQLNDNQESGGASNPLTTNHNDNNNNKLANSRNMVSDGSAAAVTVGLAEAASNVSRAADSVANDTISVHVQTELLPPPPPPSLTSSLSLSASSTAAVNRKSCNSASDSYARHEYLNGARTHNRKVVGPLSGGGAGAATTTATHLPSSSLSIRVDVTHDVYDIEHGLVNNVVYVGKSRFFSSFVVFCFFCSTHTV